MISEPISIYANFNRTIVESKPITKLFSPEKFGITDNIKLFMMPLDKNKILMRFENLSEEPVMDEIDVKSIASALWIDVNDNYLTNFNV